MRTLLWRANPQATGDVVGTVRVDRDLRALAGRLREGEFAVIDRVDLDRQSAELLVSAGARAIVNAAPTVSGRYPSLGATVVLDADVALLDRVGSDVLSTLKDGDEVRLVGDELHRRQQFVARGIRQDASTVADSLAQAEAGLATQMEAFAASAAEYLRREHHLLLEPGGLPELRTSLQDRDVVVVAPGPDARDDLKRLRGYAREYRPAVIAVGPVADAAREAGFKPTIVVGDLSDVSDQTIRGAADLIVTTGAEGSSGGLLRIDRMGLARTVVNTTVRPQDLALLIADQADARVIVLAGADRTLTSMLDSGQTAAAADFVTRLRVGSRLHDAEAVARMHRPRISGWLVALLLLVSVMALGVAAWLTPTGHDLIDDLLDSVRATPTEATSTEATSNEEASNRGTSNEQAST